MVIKMYQINSTIYKIGLWTNQQAFYGLRFKQVGHQKPAIIGICYFRFLLLPMRSDGELFGGLSNSNFCPNLGINHSCTL